MSPPVVAAFRAVFAFPEARSARAAAMGAGFLCTLALVVAPPAYANVDLAVGMPITIGSHGCSLGFFGFDARRDRLAVTAGHCSDYEPNEPVYANTGVQIGEVVAWKEDAESASRKLIGARGYTEISLYSRFSLEPFFTGVRSSISDGDYVSKFGQRTGKTNGVIKDVEFDHAGPIWRCCRRTLFNYPATPVVPGTPTGTRWSAWLRAEMKNRMAATPAARLNRSKQCST